ncbi:MAG: ATP12 family chaperone protein [Beijerinckiaceae bacterium]
MTDQRNFLESLLTNDMDPAAYDPVRSARKAMRPPMPKRFWKEVSVLRDDDGYTLALDGKAARTPARHPLQFPDAALAEAVAEEWRAVGEHLDPAAMPLTRLANSAIDGVSSQRDGVVADAAKYAGSDLLCYRATTPDSLIRRQAGIWDPLLVWASDALSARLVTTQGIAFQAQDAQALAAITRAVQAIPAPFGLAAFHSITTLTGSVVLALAVAHGRLTSDQAWDAAHLDEDFQISQWGRDEEADERRAIRRREFDAAVLMLALAR